MRSIKHLEFFEQCLNRHWCPRSEPYAGGDCLLTALERGWHITQYSLDTTQHCLTQRVTLHVFELQSGDETIVMRVIANPYVDRLIDRLNRGERLHLTTRSNSIRPHSIKQERTR